MEEALIIVRRKTGGYAYILRFIYVHNMLNPLVPVFARIRTRITIVNLMLCAIEVVCTEILSLVDTFLSVSASVCLTSNFLSYYDFEYT